MAKAIVNRCHRYYESLPPGYMPIGRVSGPKYRQVCQVIMRICDTRSASAEDVDAISAAKGFYGKAYDQHRSGQCDWHSVWLMLGEVEKTFAHRARMALYDLRQCISSGGDINEFLNSPKYRSLFRHIRINLGEAERALLEAGF